MGTSFQVVQVGLVSVTDQSESSTGYTAFDWTASAARLYGVCQRAVEAKAKTDWQYVKKVLFKLSPSVLGFQIKVTPVICQCFN